jgi:hypothetical protein
MDRGELLSRILWGALMAYTGIAIFVPQIRIYWRGKDFKVGVVSSIGLASFFWWPMIAAAFFPEWPNALKAVISFLLFIGLSFVGYLMDKYPLHR